MMCLCQNPFSLRVQVWLLHLLSRAANANRSLIQTAKTKRILNIDFVDFITVIACLVWTTHVTKWIFKFFCLVLSSSTTCMTQVRRVHMDVLLHFLAVESLFKTQSVNWLITYKMPSGLFTISVGPTLSQLAPEIDLSW